MAERRLAEPDHRFRPWLIDGYMQLLSLFRRTFVTAPPVLGEVSPSFLIQKEGETVDIFCEAAATPDPVLTWTKDGRELARGDRVSITGNRIQVRRLVRSDGGVYACTFKNVVGQISHTIKLVIEGEDEVLFDVF